MALRTIVPFTYPVFVAALGRVVTDLCLALELHEPRGWSSVLNRYQFGEMGRTEGEAVRWNYHNAIREAQNAQDRITVMNEIAGWGRMAEIEIALAQSVNATLNSLDNEQNLSAGNIEGKRIATISKIYEMWDPGNWIIYDSYSAKGLQWLVSSYWQSQQQEILPEYLKFPFPPGRAHTTLGGFPAVGTRKQAALGFVYASWLARAFAEQLNNQEEGNTWQAYQVEMALFQLGHEI